MSFQCKGTCRNIDPHIVTKKPSKGTGYVHNVRFCSVCNKGYLNVTWIKCPCCKNILRIPECNLQSRVKRYIDVSDIEKEIVILA